MLYEEAYQIGGDPNYQSVSIAIFDKTALAEKENRGFPAHSHSFYEMDYTLDGYAEFKSDNRIVRAEQGTLLFFPPLCIHSIETDQRKRNLTIQFSPRLLKDSIGNFEQNQMLTAQPRLRTAAALPVSPAVEAWIRQLLCCVPCLTIPFPENYRQIILRTPDQKMEQMSFLLLILAELLKENCLRIESTEFDPENLPKMNKLLKLIVEHPEAKLSMENAAAFVGMSYSNFCRTFKNAIGSSYVDFTNSMRCTRAKELLSQTELSVTEISMRLGFGSISYFNRIFKRFAGMTPLAYRANCIR